MRISKALSRAQCIVEYSICVAAIILAVITIQAYLRRGLQGRYADLVRQATAQVSSQPRYEPYYLNEDFTTNQTKDIQSHIQGEGRQRTDIIEDLISRRGTSIQGINCYDDE